MHKESLPVTTSLRIIPAEGKEAACLQWMQAIAAVASRFNGHLGFDIFQSTTGTVEYINIFHFDTYQHLMAWEHSAERKEWVEKGKAWIGEVKSKQTFSGIDFWFEPPKATTPAPSKYKMVILSVGVIFFFLNTLIPSFQYALSNVPLPPLVKMFLGVVLMVSLMTWVVMPGMVKLFSKWLFKAN